MILNQAQEEYIIRLDKGNKIIENIINFCQKNQIKGAWLSGIGAVSRAELSLYDLNKKKYINKIIQGPFEIANLNGNVGTVNNTIKAHIHIVLSDQEMKAYGGHLIEAEVSATCEIKMQILDVELTRKHDNTTGLDLIKIN